MESKVIHFTTKYFHKSEPKGYVNIGNVYLQTEVLYQVTATVVKNERLDWEHAPWNSILDPTAIHAGASNLFYHSDALLGCGKQL